MDCPKCVELLLQTEIEPFALGQMVQSGNSHICNMCDYEIEKLPDNKIDLLVSQFHNSAPGYTSNPDLLEQINSLLWQVENREFLQELTDLLHAVVFQEGLKDLQTPNHLRQLFLDCHN